ncbi:MAG: biopolymer transporter ExbD [Myxococcales bacterium]|nr:biopolymer transporter ExbD [Myxococcales bacterium]
MNGASRHRRRSLSTGEATVSLIPMMSLFTILVPMMLLSAVFEKVTTLQAKLPGSASFISIEDQKDEPTGIEELQVWLSKTGIQIKLRSYDLEGPEKDVYKEHEASFPLKDEDEAPDLDAFGLELLRIKKQYPSHKKAVLVADNDVRYESIVQVMDAIREHVEFNEQRRAYDYVEMFPDISISQRFQEEMFLTTPEEGKAG